MKRILLLTAGYGEGHNAAARGIQAALKRVAPEASVEVHDLFAETWPRRHKLIRRAYLGLINRWPRAWGLVYEWLDQKSEFDSDFNRLLGPVKETFARVLENFKPDVIASVFPPYPYLFKQIAPNHEARTVAVVTDSITVNAIWYRAPANYFVVPNEPSADVLRAGGVPEEKIKTLGFPVNPAFADLSRDRDLPVTPQLTSVVYMINAGTAAAPDIVRRLLDLGVNLTVTVGRDEKLRKGIAKAAGGNKIEIIGWTDQLPQLLCRSHLLIGKAGGATVQETIAAACPMIINHIVSGQEEGNARLITQSRAGIIALSPVEVAAVVQRALANNAELWSEWFTNIARLSRPAAALDIARFLLTL